MSYEPNSADIVDLGRYRGLDMRVFAPCPDGDWPHHCIRSDRRLWQQDVLDCLLRHIPVSPHVVDVGSHSGSSAIWFAVMAGAKSVMAIEPDPLSYNLLEANVRLNGLEDRIRTVNSAVWSDSGRAYLESDSITDHGSAQYRPCTSDEKLSVPRHSIDELMKDVKHKVDVLFLEMEGYEYMAIQGARKTIAESKPVIVTTMFKPTAVSVNPNYDCMQGHVRFMCELANLGYTEEASRYNTMVFTMGEPNEPS